jgi:thiamine pyrophosphate-dependent acetolactate synthase large subunit-like protein
VDPGRVQLADEEASAGPLVHATAGEALVRMLVACGVRDAYGVPAGKLAGFMQPLAGSEIRYVGTRHEAAAAWMAAATFQATGRLAVCFGESGPGSHNLVGGLGTASNNNLAALVITSGAPPHLAYPFSGTVMAVDNQALFSGCTRWGAVVRDAHRLPELVHRAVREALTGRPGPVHLEIPAEVMDARVDYPVRLLDAPLDQVLPAPTVPEGPALERAAAILLAAERLLVISGGGVAVSGATPELRALVEQLGAAATATQMGLGTISTADPRFFGHGGIVGGGAVRRAMSEADAVLAIGCRFSAWLWDGSEPFVRGWPEQELIQIDTDASAIGRLRPVSVGLQGDAKATLRALAGALDGRGGAASPEWLDSLVEEYAAYRRQLHTLGADGLEPMHPAALAEEIGAALPADSLVVYDGGHTTFWSNDLTPATSPRSRFHEPGMAHLGFGIPYALALKTHWPERTVVNITGDGAFGFTIQELDTARRYGLAAVHVIHNNAAWGVIRLGQSRRGFEFGTDLEETDYVAIARGFGCHAERVTRPEEVRPALERALASGLPAVIDAQVRFEPHPGMRYFAAAGTRPG